jgi:7-cyano-7-deazaguanine synthase
LDQTAVLISAGLDSVVLAAAEAQRARVHPIYVSAGLAWEAEERAALERLLAAPPLAGATEPLVSLSFALDDLYPPTHWALRGEPPAFDTPDEDVYLLGRNLALLSKAAIYCAQRRISRIALALLFGNPFPDASAEFFDSLERPLSLGLAQPIQIATPFYSMTKSDVIQLGVALGVPLELTLSCMSPQEGRHCGRCSKCRERRDGFSQAGVEDPTAYAVAPLR